MPRTRSSAVPLFAAATLAGASGVVTTLVLAWVAPAVMLYFGWLSASKSADTWWTDGTRGGHYVREHHALWERLDFRRIIFVGGAESQPYYKQNAPPEWAAVVSLDQREGFEEVVTTATGWPWRCFRGENWVDWTPPESGATPLSFTIQDGTLAAVPPPVWTPEQPRGLWVLARGGTAVGEIPFLPMWAGLAGNAAVFAGVWLVPLVGIGVVRRRLRKRGGKCVGCGYDRRGLAAGAACPECGRGSGTA